MKVVRVKIAVVVDERGNWSALGWKGDPKLTTELLLDTFDPDGNQVVHFVEADVPLPEYKTIKGEVTDGTN